MGELQLAVHEAVSGQEPESLVGRGDPASVGAEPVSQFELQVQHVVADNRMRLAASVHSRTPAKMDSMGLLEKRWVQ
ncbi:MAG TPA: hypothetical protein VNH82_01200 [Candidatus Dormibacteraeota bacterium]|nr:hypothetical protein [Candidatus Dormibacteraeota bacterium]